MSYQLHSDEEKKLQRKLIPLNLVVALVALVAAISLIVTPLLKINFGTIASSFGSENSEGEGGESSDGGTAQYAVLFKNVDAEIVLSPLDMVKVLVAPAEEKRAILVNSWLIENGVMEEVLVSFVNMSLVLATKEVQSEQLADIDLPKLNEALAKADEVQSRDELLTVLDDYLAVLERESDVTLTEDMKTSARDNCLEMYDTTVAATGGEFSVEKMICVNMTPEGGEPYASYSDLVAAMLSGDFGSSDGSENPLAQVTEILDTVAAPYGYMFIYVAFNALVWFILFLFAFFRIFAKNKRFTMWYVKLIGCWPCIIFGVMLSFGMSMIAGAVAALAPYAGMFAAFSSYTWISGGCYLLLWLLSICWAFPIKHKIRKLRKGK